MKQLIIAAIVCVAAVSALLAYTYGATAIFAPLYSDVRNSTFKNSQAYNDGMANDLADFQIQYLATKDADVKAAIASTVKHRFASYPKERLPSDLRAFYESL